MRTDALTMTKVLLPIFFLLELVSHRFINLSVPSIQQEIVNDSRSSDINLLAVENDFEIVFETGCNRYFPFHPCRWSNIMTLESSNQEYRYFITIH